MKSLAFFLISMTATAQITDIDTTGKDQYINVRFELKKSSLLTNKTTDYTILLNMGEATDGNYKEYQDLNGEPYYFKGIVAILNHLYSKGWIMFDRRGGTLFANTDILVQKNN